MDFFRILGIEITAGLDPNNVTAFITKLTFTNQGRFTGTMTPIIDQPHEIQIDIKPEVNPNRINLKSKGIVPVAILTTQDFEAGTVNPATVILAGASPVRWKMSDANGDGEMDMLFYFDTQSLNLTQMSTEAVLTGEDNGGIHLQGTDSVEIVH